MIKIASIVLASSIGVAGLAQSMPAEAHPFVRGSGGVHFLDRVALAPAYYGNGYYAYSPYWRPGYLRFGHERFYRRWYRR